MAREAEGDKHSLSVSPGLGFIILTLSSPVTLSHVGNGGLWEILGLAQVQGLGGSQISQACLAFGPIVRAQQHSSGFQTFLVAVIFPNSISRMSSTM